MEKVNERDFVAGLIEILLNESVDIAERDDAGMDLGSYPDARSIQPLITIILDPMNEDYFIQACAESLAEIWVHLGYFDKETVKKMTKQAQNEVVGIFSSRRPEWHKELVAYLDWQDK